MIELVLGIFIGITASGNVAADAQFFPTVEACQAANAQVAEAARRADASIVELGCFPMEIEPSSDDTL